MAPKVIDLTSSPEPEESPSKAASSALQKFQPRSQKVASTQPEKKRSAPKPQNPGKAAQPTLQQPQWRSDTSYGRWNRESSRPVPSLLEVGKSLSRESEVQDRNVSYKQPTYQAPDGPVYPPHGHPLSGVRQTNGLTLHATSTSLSRNTTQPARPQSTALLNRPVAKQSVSKTSSTVKPRAEVIVIDEDSDSSSSSSGASESELRAFIRENNLDDIRPFKRRRVDGNKSRLHQSVVADTKKPKPVNGALATAPRPSIERNRGLLVHHASGVFTKPSPLAGKGQVPSDRTRGDSVSSRSASITSRPKSSTPRVVSTASVPGPVVPLPQSNKPGSLSDGTRPNHTAEEVLKSSAFANGAGKPTSGQSQRPGDRSESKSSRASTHGSAHTGLHSNSPVNQDGLETFEEERLLPDDYESARSVVVAPYHTAPATKNGRKAYTQAENDLLFKLRRDQKLGWKQILTQMPGRSEGSITGHYSELLAGKHKGYPSLSTPLQQDAARADSHSQVDDEPAETSRVLDQLERNHMAPQSAGQPTEAIPGQSGQREAQPYNAHPKAIASPKRDVSTATTRLSYSQTENDLLIRLKEVEKLEWNSILKHFPGRTIGSISGHYGQIKSRSQGVKSEPVKPIKPFVQNSTTRSYGGPYSKEEDALIVKFKEVDKLSWHEIVPLLPGRSFASIQVHYSSKLKSKTKAPPSKPTRPTEHAMPIEQAGSTGNHGAPYSKEEDALILRLREEGLSWDQMVASLNGRTAGSLAVRYSTKLKAQQSRHTATDSDDVQLMSTDDDAASRPQRRRRHIGASVLSGFISWADVKRSRRNVLGDEESVAEDEQEVQKPSKNSSWSGGERQHPRSIQRILRQREIGSNSGRGWTPSTRSVPDELIEHVFDDIGPRRYFQGTSGDVTCIAWAADGHQFAAGSIALTDERSMQYNKPCNLLLGDTSESVLYELPEHHIRRPVNADAGNVNSLQSMRETQDERLFMTVGSVQFSPDGRMLYSAGTDQKVRAYRTDSNARPSCQYEIEHPAPVYLLSVSKQDVLATSCHQSADGSIRVHNGHYNSISLSPSRTDSQTERPILPSALQWGISSHHSNLLLAGFSIDSTDEERNLAGETCLWDVHHQARIEVNAVTRNVFDVAWNPSPSSGSTAFAVASTPGVNKVNRGTRTVVQCFAPRQNRAVPVLEFESRAFDINDVVYCPHDNNLIAAGATDGKIYIWDQRYAKKGSAPLQVLAHGDSLNVLDHDREREVADTGVRFLSWGATSSRLYTGSSDGVVKVWNPYRSSRDAHVKDMATLTSAVMSGAFSPDYRDLLIGEDQGRINLLSVGHTSSSIRSMGRFELCSAPVSVHQAASGHPDGRRVTHELLSSGQIELKPMGALPIRQAVQGRNYKGPYLAPSSEDLQEAESEYQVALNNQNEAHSNAAVGSMQTSDVDQSVRDADKRVEAIQETMLRLQSRLDDSTILAPKAEATQRAFKRAEKDRTNLEASLSHALEHCKLDCNYLPANVEEDAAVTDSRRSEGRIPAALWRVPDSNTADMDVDELMDAGHTRKCMTCFKPARKLKRGLPTCDSCARIKSGLTATCEICSSSVRPSVDGKSPTLCERCNFACFRCGKPAILECNATKISCYACDLSWTAGVLGYTLVT